MKHLTAQPSRHLNLPPRERSPIIRWHLISHRKMPNKFKAQAGNPFQARLTGERAHLLKGMEAKRGRRALRVGARRTVLYSRTNRRSIGNTTSHRAYLLQGKLTRTLQIRVRIPIACIRPLFLKNLT